MSHRKQKETKQQPGTAGPGNILGCCLVSLHFLRDIHSTHLVDGQRAQAGVGDLVLQALERGRHAPVVDLLHPGFLGGGGEWKFFPEFPIPLLVSNAKCQLFCVPFPICTFDLYVLPIYIYYVLICL